MSSTRTGSGAAYLSRRRVTNIFVIILFLIALTSAVSWLSSGAPEKRLSRTRMIEELKKEQREESPGPSAGYDVTALVDDEYFRRLTGDLNRARERVDVLMFEVKLGKSSDNPANLLVSNLIAAKDRGVTVHVRLEQSEQDPRLTRTNRQAADYLREHGIFAEFDFPEVETHAKAVLIDGRILYIGNHNWSESSLRENKEVSLRVESPKAITAMRRYFDRFDQSLQKARTGESG